MGERYDHIFPESNTNRPIFGRVAEISMAESPNPQLKNPKITKKRHIEITSLGKNKNSENKAQQIFEITILEINILEIVFFYEITCFRNHKKHFDQTD